MISPISLTAPTVRSELKLTPGAEFRIAGRSARLGVFGRHIDPPSFGGIHRDCIGNLFG